MTKYLSIAVTGSVCTLLLTTVVLAADAPPRKTPRMGYKAPDFTLNALDGTPVSLSKLLAKSSVVLVVLRGYPGYQCPNCTAQVGELISRADEFAAANAEVVLVYPGAAAKLAEHAGEFLKSGKLPARFTLLLDPDYKFTDAYNLRLGRAERNGLPVHLRDRPPSHDPHGKNQQNARRSGHGRRSDQGAAVRVRNSEARPSHFFALFASAVSAQQVAGVEMNWSVPCGSPLSNITCTGVERVLTNHDPSSCCVRNRNSRPRWHSGAVGAMPVAMSTHSVCPVA